MAGTVERCDEVCGRCREIRPIVGSSAKRCAYWQGLAFWIEVKLDQGPLKNLEEQNKVAFWIARNIIKRYSKSICFWPER